jgi:hypothetical protein
MTMTEETRPLGRMGATFYGNQDPVILVKQAMKV